MGVVEVGHALDSLHDFETLLIKSLAPVHVVDDQMDTMGCHEDGLHGECVAIVEVKTESYQRKCTLDDVLKDLDGHVLSSVQFMELVLLLVDLLDLVFELLLPAVELESLDVVKGLNNV